MFPDGLAHFSPFVKGFSFLDGSSCDCIGAFRVAVILILFGLLRSDIFLSNKACKTRWIVETRLYLSDFANS
jgi:hypothetical protein